MSNTVPQSFFMMRMRQVLSLYFPDRIVESNAPSSVASIHQDDTDLHYNDVMRLPKELLEGLEEQEIGTIREALFLVFGKMAELDLGRFTSVNPDDIVCRLDVLNDAIENIESPNETDVAAMFLIKKLQDASVDGAVVTLGQYQEAVAKTFSEGSKAEIGLQQKKLFLYSIQKVDHLFFNNTRSRSDLGSSTELGSGPERFISNEEGGHSHGK